MSRFLKPAMEALTPYSPGEQPTSGKLIKLNTNENPYPPSPRVKEALSLMEKDTFRLYPDPEANEAVTAIAAYYGLQPDQVVLGNGSDEILAFLYLAYADKVYFPVTSYGFYPVFSSMFQCEAVPVPMGMHMKIDSEDYAGNDGMVMMTNPNAPTGMALTLSEIEQILQQNPDQVVAVDEAYVDFGAQTSVPLIDRYDNLVVVQTLSKSRSLAGIRIGFAMGNAELIADINRIRFSFNPYNLSREAIAAAAASIGDEEYFQLQRKKIMETRDAFAEKIKEMGFEVLPSVTNFVFIKTGAAYYDKLRERNILVRHWDTPEIKDYIRVTIGREEEMEQMLQAMEEIKCEEQA